MKQQDQDQYAVILLCYHQVPFTAGIIATALYVIITARGAVTSLHITLQKQVL